MRSRLLALTALAAALVGCDTSGPDPDVTLTCEDVSLSSDGTLTAWTASGTFRADCFSAQARSGGVTLIGLEVVLEGGLASSGEVLGSIEIDVEGTGPGTYDVGPSSGPRAEVAYSPSGSTSLEATSGTVTLTELSATRVQGTFSFETANGTSVSGGAFDVGL